jgi:hypothetical protein
MVVFYKCHAELARESFKVLQRDARLPILHDAPDNLFSWQNRHYGGKIDQIS